MLANANNHQAAMRNPIAGKHVARTIASSVIALWITPVIAQNHAEGALVVDDKPVSIAWVSAYAQEGWADAKKEDIVVVLCDSRAPATAISDSTVMKELVGAGKLTCIKQVINSDKVARDSEVWHKRLLSRPPRGYTSDQVFEAKTFDGKTIAGRARTTTVQKSFDGVPYSYDITFSAAIIPKQ